MRLSPSSGSIDLRHLPQQVLTPSEPPRSCRGPGRRAQGQLRRASPTLLPRPIVLDRAQADLRSSPLALQNKAIKLAHELNEVDEGATGDKTSYAKEAAGGDAKTNKEADEKTGGAEGKAKSEEHKKESQKQSEKKADEDKEDDKEEETKVRPLDPLPLSLTSAAHELTRASRPCRTTRRRTTTSRPSRSSPRAARRAARRRRRRPATPRSRTTTTRRRTPR